jgi:hypothetical protein
MRLIGLEAVLMLCPYLFKNGCPILYIGLLVIIAELLPCTTIM